MRGALPLVAVLAALPAPLAAQSYQCRLPAAVAVPRIVADGPVRRVPVTGYTLALSWSPEFCRTRASDAAHSRQCGGRAGQFGLVVHGLWPEGGATWPQWCAARRAPSAAQLRANLCLTPSARLLAHEWAKHGSCMTRDPGRYFRVTRILYEGLRFPDLDRISRERALTAGFLRARFVDANPGWSERAVGIQLSERGWLREIRLCYDRRFMPRACDRARSGARDAAAVKIWRGL